MWFRKTSTRNHERFAGEAYGALIDAQLREERALKASVEARATAVITSSGVLVTLLFGFRALIPDTADPLGDPARWLIAGSLLAFVAAAVGAILASRPRAYEEADVAALERLTCKEFWLGPITVGTRRSAELAVDILREGRAANAKKTSALGWAFRAQLLAIGLLAGAVASELLAGQGGSQPDASVSVPTLSESERLYAPFQHGIDVSLYFVLIDRADGIDDTELVAHAQGND